MPTRSRTEPPPEPEPELEEELEIPLSESARVEVTVAGTFTYRGLTYWPKVTVSDSMMAFPVPSDDPNAPLEYELEGQESLTYRVEQVAHTRFDAVIARMKRGADERYETDQAARRAAAPEAGVPAQENTGGTS